MEPLTRGCLPPVTSRVHDCLLNMQSKMEGGFASLFFESGATARISRYPLFSSLENTYSSARIHLLLLTLCALLAWWIVTPCQIVKCEATGRFFPLGVAGHSVGGGGAERFCLLSNT